MSAPEKKIWPLRLDCGCIIEAVGHFYSICNQHEQEIDAAKNPEEEMAIAERLVEHGK